MVEATSRRVARKGYSLRQGPRFYKGPGTRAFARSRNPPRPSSTQAKATTSPFAPGGKIRLARRSRGRDGVGDEAPGGPTVRSQTGRGLQPLQKYQPPGCRPTVRARDHSTRAERAFQRKADAPFSQASRAVVDRDAMGVAAEKPATGRTRCEPLGRLVSAATSRIRASLVARQGALKNG